MPEAKGRESFLAASQAVDAAIAQPATYGPKQSLEWAREQIRLQAIQHVRSLGGRPNQDFMRHAASAIHALDDLLRREPELGGISMPAPSQEDPQ